MNVRQRILTMPHFANAAANSPCAQAAAFAANR
jgi:hypothetical protein